MSKYHVAYLLGDLFGSLRIEQEKFTPESLEICETAVRQKTGDFEKNFIVLSWNKFDEEDSNKSDILRVN